MFDEFPEAKLRNPALFFSGHLQLLTRIMPQTALEQREHFSGSAAGRADDENVAEAGLVLTIRSVEPAPDLVVCIGDPGLLLVGPIRPARLS